jgi:Zinc finger, C3HC4 type (RING finger)
MSRPDRQRFGATTIDDSGELHSKLSSLRILQPATANNDFFGDAGSDPSQDECPICHSKRYLRRDMRFLINPECYHKMCESCVERIFSHGPAPCPVAGCSKTLKRNGFRLPTFDDLRLEREIDIRKTIVKVCVSFPFLLKWFKAD